VPITLIVGKEEMPDDENLDTAVFLEKMKASKVCPKTACPSPDAFAEIMRRGENVIVVTLSSKLSGTHQSAMIAAEMIKAETPDKKLFVLDGLTAAAGVAKLLLSLTEFIQSGEFTFEQITEKLTRLATRTRTRFLLQDLTNLIKNGRMGKIVGTIINTAKIKLICEDNRAGEIKKQGMALSTRRGLQKMAEMIKSDVGSYEEKEGALVTITHAHNKEDAFFLKSFLQKLGFNNIKVMLMRGTATLYAADKGIVVAC